MKERPIIFSAPMVRAILDGRKTQTRRVFRKVSSDCIGFIDDGNGMWAQRFIDERGDPHLKAWRDRCPHGAAGDRLWVREAWRIGAWDEVNGRLAIDYCDGPRKEWLSIPDPMQDDGAMFNRLWRQSTDDAIKALGQQDRYEWDPGQSPCRWRPSIHMPRWASRITLEITRVRVDRLHDITEADAMAEGVERTVMGDGWRRYGIDPDCEEAGVPPMATARGSYFTLWNQIHPSTWDANPWVWVIEFKKVSEE